MKLDYGSYEKYFKGYFLADCVVRDKNILYFVLQQDDDESSAPLTRIVSCINMSDVQPWGYVQLRGMQKLLAGVSLTPKEQFVGVSLNDHVYVLGAGEKELENDLKGVDSRQLKEQNASADQYLMRGGINKLRTIDGRLYGCGLGRTVIERVGKSEWYYHIDLPEVEHFLDPVGFKDIDGFSEKDK